MTQGETAGALDAIVVGAGLSGLVCARRLVAEGARVAVLEAQPQVGGRLRNGRVAGTVVDLGGHWMSVGQPRLAALAGELGVASQPQRRAGRSVIDDDGARGGLFAQLRCAIAQWRAMRRIERLARSLSIREPRDATRGGVNGRALPAQRGREGPLSMDAIALGPWLAGTIGNAVARERIAMHAALVLAADPDDVSLLAYLARLGATGGFSPRGPDLPGGGRDHTFVGGAAVLAERLAAPLGEIIELGTAVQSIEHGGGRVAVRTTSGERFARHVVLAVPPQLAAPLAPMLPVAVRELAGAMIRGGVIKCFAAYDRAFWRDAGLSGEAYCPGSARPLRAVVDASPPGDGPAILLGFVVGRAAADWHRRTAGDRRAEVLGALGELFGDPARAPLDYLEHDWAIEPWSAGCVASTPPGALTSGAIWRGAHGPVHLAGTESAVAWPGYMEGAIEAGDRAAGEVLAALSVLTASAESRPSRATRAP